VLDGVRVGVGAGAAGANDRGRGRGVATGALPSPDAWLSLAPEDDPESPVAWFGPGVAEGSDCNEAAGAGAADAASSSTAIPALQPRILTSYELQASVRADHRRASLAARREQVKVSRTN
jgi:hypothetical protein